MKLSFTGDSLKDIHQQIIAAADELTREDVASVFGITDPKIHKTEIKEHSVEDIQTATANIFNPPKKEFISNEPSVVTAPFAQPQSDGHVPAGTQSTSIDGHSVSSGQVWLPVEGRGSAYRGVPVDEYLKQKEAKESGGELDAAGTPYNPAIHTSTRTKTTKGLWKNRPGGGAVKAAEVTEPREVVHKITPSGDVKLEWQTATTEPAKPASVQQVVAHEDSQPAIGRAPSMHNYESFKTNLMTIVVRLINENKITRDYMKDLNTYFQVANLWDVKNDDAKCQQLFKLFLEYQFIMGA